MHHDPSTAPRARGTHHALILGGGELGQELAIAAQRLGLHVSVAAHYEASPASRFAHDVHILDISCESELLALISTIRPDLIIPEIEAISLEALLHAEEHFGVQVVPSARAVAICMDRKKLRLLASSTLSFPTSVTHFVRDEDSILNLLAASSKDHFLKPLHSSSGRGQSHLPARATPTQVHLAVRGARGDARRPARTTPDALERPQLEEMLLEERIDFMEEVTLLTILTAEGEVFFCDPIAHTQHQGDYRLSWQPVQHHPALDARWETILEQMQEMASRLVRELGGAGLFGVEFFLTARGEVYFSEASPRPHDTGFVTQCTQDRDEFELHLLAALGLLTSAPRRLSPGASAALTSNLNSEKPAPHFATSDPLRQSGVSLRLFQKPTAHVGRRMGVALASAPDVEQAKARVLAVQSSFQIIDRSKD